MNKTELERNQKDDYHDESESISEEEDELERSDMKNTNLLLISAGMIALMFLLGLAWVIFAYFKSWSLV